MAMSVDQTTCEDLKAFERRLTEVIACIKPATNRWRTLLAFVTMCSSVGAYYWLHDPALYSIPLWQSLYNNPVFTVSSVVLLILLLMGIHKKVMAPSIIASRARCVLGEFNMSCDDNGKLILKPRPTMN